MADLIRVLHVVHSLNDGGIERLLLEICRKIDKKRFEVQVCCLVEVGNLAPEFEKLKIKLHFLGSKRHFSIKNIFINIKKIFELRKIIRSERINITHGHEFYPTIFSRVGALIAGVRYRFITLHNMYYWWNNGVHFTQYLLSFITTKIVCNSYATFKFSLAKERINEDRYLVIYNGIDCDEFSDGNLDKNSVLQRLGLQYKKKVFVSVGNISPRKGFEIAIRAIDSLKDKFDSMLYLIIGGKHHQETEEYERLMTLIKENSLEEIVIITGRRNDVSDILNACDIYLMPSVVEGFGISLIEALAMKKIVIASDIEPFKEIIDEGSNGFFFESGNYKDLAEKILKITTSDAQSLDRIREQSREKVVSKFNSRHMVEAYSKMYLENCK